MPSFPNLEALNAWLEAQCIAQWAQIEHGMLAYIVAHIRAAEGTSLMPLGRPFDALVEHTKRVLSTCLVSFDRTRYSVPASFANARSGCGCTRTGPSSPPMFRSCASTSGSSNDPITLLVGQSMTGDIIWR